MITPAEMPQSILNLPKGAEWLTPLHTGVNNGYVTQNGDYAISSSSQNSYNIYIYDVSNYYGKVVFVFKKTLTGTLDRFRVSAYARDPATVTTSMSVQTTNHPYDDNTYNNNLKYYNVLKTIAESYAHYLTVYTGSNALEHEIFVGVANDLLQ